MARRMAITVFLLCFCLSWLPYYTQAASTADASEPISPDKECSLTVSYRYDGKNFSNHPITLYKIADVSADFQYTLTSAFSNSGLILNGIQSVGEWNVIRSTLETHILAYDVRADLVAMTDPDGKGCFQALKPGLYLVTTEQVNQDGWIYSFDSALISLPGLGSDGLWQYEVASSPKPKATPPIETDEEISFSVLKLWKGDHDRTDRPQSVKVEIFRNEESYHSVTLSEENHWTYRWSARDDGAIWKVVERNIPSGYSMTVEKRDASFIVTNSWAAEDPGSTKPPQSGDTSNIMLYVILMIISGSMLIILGMTGKRKCV